jgi:hypothetical protein
MSSFEAEIPQYYVVKKGLNDPETAYVLAALKITPVLSVIITDPRDCDFALTLSDQVTRSPSIEAAHTLARNIAKASGKPVLLIGDSPFLTGIMADGTRQELASTC